jgi:hypothetical protein
MRQDFPFTSFLNERNLGKKERKKNRQGWLVGPAYLDWAESSPLLGFLHFFLSRKREVKCEPSLEMEGNQ